MRGILVRVVASEENSIKRHDISATNWSQPLKNLVSSPENIIYVLRWNKKDRANYSDSFQNANAKSSANHVKKRYMSPARI